MKISHDLERIGDLAKSVAKKVKPLPVDLPEELIGSLRRLGDLVQKQLKDALDAYLNRSKDKAIEIWKKDEHFHFFKMFGEKMKMLTKNEKMKIFIFF